MLGLCRKWKLLVRVQASGDLGSTVRKYYDSPKVLGMKSPSLLNLAVKCSLNPKR